MAGGDRELSRQERERQVTRASQAPPDPSGDDPLRPPLVRSIEEKIMLAGTPAEAARWLPILREVKEQIRIDHPSRITVVSDVVKLIMPVIFFIVGILFLILGAGRFDGPGLFLLAAAIATFSPESVGSLIKAIDQTIRGGTGHGGS